MWTPCCLHSTKSALKPETERLAASPFLFAGIRKKLSAKRFCVPAGSFYFEIPKSHAAEAFLANDGFSPNVLQVPVSSSAPSEKRIGFFAPSFSRCLLCRPKESAVCGVLGFLCLQGVLRGRICLRGACLFSGFLFRCEAVLKVEYRSPVLQNQCGRKGFSAF